jgi:carboxymethylenebutenolidase
MGELVTFPSNGTEGQGYLALPSSGAGPGVVVLQEWWGLNDQIKEVCDRFASEGFVALAPDIYRGEVTAEPDEAGKLMMALNIEQAAKDMAGAIDFLRAHPAVTSEGVGVVGFCMGGGLALWLATLRPDDVLAVVP